MENNVNKSNKNEKSTSLVEKIIKKLFSREVIVYLVFGVLTTLVGWAVYFTLMSVGRAMFAIPSDDDSSVKYLVIYTVAQVTQWVCAVLFAFFTNRKWVFTDADKTKNIFAQLLSFASGRILTFGIDFAVTYLGVLALSALFPMLDSLVLLGKERNVNEIIAKIVTAVIVVVCNYIFSKLFVFKKKK